MDGHKRCTKCGNLKTLNEFGREKTRPDGKRSNCRTCVKAGDAKRWKTSPERREKSKRNQRAWVCRRVYGISLEDYEARIEAQDGKCAICGNESAYRGERRTKLHLDHCHETGQIRGMLCNKCNGGLGLFHDDINLMLAAVAYLQQYEPRT